MIDKMKKLFAWVGIDGLLHILTCYALNDRMRGWVTILFSFGIGFGLDAVQS